MKLCKMKQPDSTAFLFKKDDGTYHQLNAGPTTFSEGVHCWLTDDQYIAVKEFVVEIIKEVHGKEELH